MNPPESLRRDVSFALDEIIVPVPNLYPDTEVDSGNKHLFLTALTCGLRWVPQAHQLSASGRTGFKRMEGEHLPEAFICHGSASVLQMQFPNDPGPNDWKGQPVDLVTVTLLMRYRPVGPGASAERLGDGNLTTNLLVEFADVALDATALSMMRTYPPDYQPRSMNRLLLEHRIGQIVQTMLAMVIIEGSRL